MVNLRQGRDTSCERVGKLLLEARIRKGLLLEDIARDTCIPVEQLQALEVGDYSVFSADVYARGAYAAYAAYLGIASNQSRLAVLRAISQTRQRSQLRIHTPPAWYDRLLQPRFIFIASASLLAFAIAMYITWQVQSFWQLPSLKIIDPATDVVSAEQVVIRGSAEPQAHVYVNKEAVLLGEGASFETVVFLQPGINVVQVEAQNAAGRTKTITRHILRPRNSMLQ